MKDGKGLIRKNGGLHHPGPNPFIQAGQEFFSIPFVPGNNNRSGFLILFRERRR